MSVGILPSMSDQRSTDPLISAFEDEQKTTVFSALSEYFRQNLFCDVVVVVDHQIIRAHKAVLAASSRFFYNAFSHYPSLNTIDIEREMAPHGISVVFEDLKLLIEMLYFEGTVEISPQRIETLLLVAQVMGIPSVIRFLRRIKDSFMNTEDAQRPTLSPVKRPLVCVQMPTSLGKKHVETRSLTFEQHSTSLLQTTSRRIFPEQNMDHEETPSRSGSRNTLTSLSSFPFNPIPSPAMESSSSANPPPILDNLDPSLFSQLNNLHANQIDDIENALLNHMHSPATVEERPQVNDLPCSSGGLTSFQLKQTTTVSAAVEDSFNSTFDEAVPKPGNGEEGKSVQGSKMSSLDVVSATTSVTANQDIPKGCSTPIRKTGGPLNISIPDSNTPDQDLMPLESPTNYIDVGEIDLPLNDSSTLNNQEQPAKSPSGTERPKRQDETPPPEEIQSHRQENDEVSSEVEDEEKARKKDEAELKIPLNESKESQSITLTVPGSSKSFTLNFSADTLNQMKMSFMRKQTNSVKKKTAFTCRLCSKSFPSKRMLAKHEKYHVEKPVTSCQECGQVFRVKWKLEQHLAQEHRNQSLDCKECGKQFQWHRNLLAHMTLFHQREVRYRCKNCPLTFLKKKAFIVHHRDKHSQAPEPWCGLCYEVFDGFKQREDHQCGKIENTGRIFICHKHTPPLEFTHQNELKEHVNNEHKDEENGLNSLQKCCPVCNKKFMLKKNLMTHMKRFHENEGSASRKFQCETCDKTFLYRYELEAHENVHQGVKSFKCHCGKGYSSKKALNDHVKIVHEATGEKFSCEICGKVLRDKYKLKYHMMVHSEKRNFKCSHCSTEFKGGENLRRHVLKFHKDAAKS